MISENEQRLIEEFSARGMLRGQEMYLPKADMVSFVRRAEALDLATIGLEGFRWVGGKLHPRLDLIADYSSFSCAAWTSFRTACNHAAERFLSCTADEPHLIFNATLVSRPEWDSAQLNDQ